MARKKRDKRSRAKKRARDAASVKRQIGRELAAEDDSGREFRVVSKERRYHPLHLLPATVHEAEILVQQMRQVDYRLATGCLNAADRRELLGHFQGLVDTLQQTHQQLRDECFRLSAWLGPDYSTFAPTH